MGCVLKFCTKFALKNGLGLVVKKYLKGLNTSLGPCVQYRPLYVYTMIQPKIINQCHFKIGCTHAMIVCVVG